MPDPLDIVIDRIRQRVDDKRHPEDRLTATFHVVSLMTDRQARLIYDALADKTLTVHDADLAQLVAQKLNIEIAWRHIDLTVGAEWQEGRGR